MKKNYFFLIIFTLLFSFSFSQISTFPYINNFEKGAIVKTQTQTNTGFQLRDELVADSFFQANNVESMNTFIRVFGQNDEAVINMQNSILDRVISKTLDPKTGLINVDKLKLFLTNNESVLNAFSKVSPDFVTTLRNKPDVISSIATRLNVLNKRKNYVEGQKLNEVYTYLGQPGTKQLRFGTADERRRIQDMLAAGQAQQGRSQEDLDFIRSEFERTG